MNRAVEALKILEECDVKDKFALIGMLSDRARPKGHIKFVR